MFDWPALLRARGIEYVASGPNVARGHIAVKCPWCGENDPSQHLGISLKGQGWGCWRNRGHRGKSKARLIEALLRCSSEEARELAGENSPSAELPPNERLNDLVASNLGLQNLALHTAGPLVLPSSAKPMASRSSGSMPFREYLSQRGYSMGEGEWIVEKYLLHYARAGQWANRLIIPVYDAAGRLVNWTGRAIGDKTKPRYKTLSTQLALTPISQCLLGLPLLWSVPNPKMLIVCEGPFDALRISVLGHELGVFGTCLFGLNASEQQALHLTALRRRFERIALCLDAGAEMSALRIQETLRVAGVDRLTPIGVKDPGELRSREGKTLIGSWL